MSEDRSKMKIVVDENIPLATDAFAEFGEVIAVNGRNVSKEMIQDADILLVRSVTKVNAELLEGTGVKFVASSTIGVDHIDRNYLHERNIGFAYAPASNADSVAEYVISAMFVMSHKQKKQLTDLTLGIIGVGNVGSRVYRYASALSIRCLLNDPPKKRMTQSDIYVSLDHVLENADIVTLHVPLVSEGEDPTIRLVNHEFLNKIKNGCILINTSRGKVVDEKSLRAAHSKLGGCVLDVWENEPGINIDTLRIADIATPHIAGYSYDGKIRGTQMIYDAACAFFFRQPSWHIPPELISERAGEIDITESVDPLYDAITAAYPIMKDDAELRQIITRPKDQQERYFDDLRKKYPRRDEFSHYVIKSKKNQSSTAILLANLGFKIETV